MSDKLFLGVGREIITPPVGSNLYGYAPDVISTSVHDDLTVTAFYFCQGDLDALLISTTVCSINTDLSDKIVSLISEEVGVPAERCMLHAIHTHSGPITTGNVGWGDIDRKYCDGIFIPGILKAVKGAKERTVSVTMGIAFGESLVGINRRELRLDNSIRLGQNPWGAFDPRMTVVSFKDEEENCVANMVHYGCHCTASGRNHEISRDWAGVMIDVLEEVSGGVTAFFNGPEGDVGPRMPSGATVGLKMVKYAVQLGGVAAQDAVRVYRSIRGHDIPKLSVSRENIRIPLDKRVDREFAEREYEKYKSETVNLKAAKGHHYKEVIDSYDAGMIDEEYKEIPQNIVKLGDLAFVSFPYELFSEIGMRIARGSKIPYTLSLSNTNGSEGYFVTEDQICRGGYEVDMFKTGHLQPYADNADYHAITETLRHLEKLY